MSKKWPPYQYQQCFDNFGYFVQRSCMPNLDMTGSVVYQKYTKNLFSEIQRARMKFPRFVTIPQPQLRKETDFITSDCQSH